MIFTGRRIHAEEALAIGLVEKVVPLDELRTAAKKLGIEIGAKAPLAVTAAKMAINRGWDMDLEEGLELESRLWGSLFDTNDQKEGAKAFLEKRTPVFKFN
jgi:enoyl-CoA hydratase